MQKRDDMSLHNNLLSMKIEVVKHPSDYCMQARFCTCVYREEESVFIKLLRISVLPNTWTDITNEPSIELSFR